MVPARFVLLAQLPLTANGKLDRARLPDPAAGPAADPASGTAARTAADLSPTEAVLAGLWSAVLGREANGRKRRLGNERPKTIGRETIGREDNFFDLGGHSLMATQLIARLRDSFAVEVPLAVVFEHPVLCEQAAELEHSPAAPPLPPIVPHPSDAAVPLSFAQQRLWFLAQLQDGGAAAASYNIAAALRLDGRLDVSALRRALCALTARQESLRVSIRSENGAPRIELTAPYDPLEEADLSGLGTAEQEAAVQARAAAHAEAPFDLAHGLLRVRLRARSAGVRAAVHPAPHRRRWLVAGHPDPRTGHLYAAACTARRPLPAAAAAGAVRRLRAVAARLAERGALERQLAYWRADLPGRRLLELPTDQPAGGADLPRRAQWRRGSTALRAAEAPGQRGRHAVHDAAGGVQVLLLR